MKMLNAVAVRARAKRPLREAMVWIPGGRFTMGSDDHYPEERPPRAVVVNGFWMDPTPVTNAQFARFVADTGHVTVAETSPDPADYPGADPSQLNPASMVFTPPAGAVDLHAPLQWWAYIPGANWRHPQGPHSSIKGLEAHPVVHVAWLDVLAYADWAGAALPTEAEWEFAARGGLERAAYAWGDEFAPLGQLMANTWQGDFPLINTAQDGWPRTSPVGTFPPNGYGLIDMMGNVWEWTADWWSANQTETGPPRCCAIHNPIGGRAEDSCAPGHLPIPRKVLKGGSHLCAPNYCRRYRPAARHAHPVDTSTSHVGFRCILRPAA